MVFRGLIVHHIATRTTCMPRTCTSLTLLSQACQTRCFHTEGLVPIFTVNTQTRQFSQCTSLATRNTNCLLHMPCLSHICHGAQRKIHTYTSHLRNTSHYSSLSVLSNQCKRFVKTENCWNLSSRNTSTVSMKSKTEKIAPVSNVGPKKSRRKATREKEQPFIYVRDHSHFINMTTYAIGVETDLIRLREALVAQNVYKILELPKDFTEVIMAEAKYKVNGKSREFFIFGDGAVSCWNMQNTEQKEILRFVQHFTEQPYHMRLVERESEMFPVILDKQTKMTGKAVFLKDIPAADVNVTVSSGARDAPPEPDLKLQSELKQLKLEKFAFSNAVVQSVKLSVWESMLEEFKEDIEPSQDSNDGQLLSIDRKKVHQKLREILQLRYDINLGSDLLDTPDVYWEREDLDLHYKKMCNHLDINKRTKVMNDKLNYCTETLELFNSRLNDERHVRLEWFIIILILIEVGFEIVHFLERVFTDRYASSPAQSADQTHNAITLDQWKRLINTSALSCDDTARRRGFELVQPLLTQKLTSAASESHGGIGQPAAASVADDDT